MSTTLGTLVVLLVVGLRLVVPLAIPRYPLPAIVACLVLDAVDQTIFQQVPGLVIDGYQQYDKALDVFYLSVAYCSTLRNWSSSFAFELARGLFYYRLVGVLAFELSNERWLLLVFPNTFEYFFIVYELVRTRWAPVRLHRRALVAMVVGIWVLVKLPQEYWLHVAELDVTDELRTRVLGVGLDAGWGAAVANRPWVPLLVAVLGVAVVRAVRRVLLALPPGDWRFGFDVDVRARGGEIVSIPASVRARQSAFVRGPLVEKVLLVSMVCIVFAQILPGVRATDTQIVLTVAVVVLLNSVVSHWAAGRGREWTSTIGQFVAVVVINTGIVAALVVLPTPGGASVDVVPAAVFLLLLSLLVTLYDRYRLLRVLRRRGRVPFLWRTLALRPLRAGRG